MDGQTLSVDWKKVKHEYVGDAALLVLYIVLLNKKHLKNIKNFIWVAFS